MICMPRTRTHTCQTSLQILSVPVLSTFGIWAWSILPKQITSWLNLFVVLHLQQAWRQIYLKTFTLTWGTFNSNLSPVCILYWHQLLTAPNCQLLVDLSSHRICLGHWMVGVRVDLQEDMTGDINKIQIVLLLLLYLPLHQVHWTKEWIYPLFHISNHISLRKLRWLHLHQQVHQWKIQLWVHLQFVPIHWTPQNLLVLSKCKLHIPKIGVLI